MIASVLYPSKCILGEGPVWHEERKSCFWVDIEDNRLFEYVLKERRARCWKLNHKITLVIPCSRDMVLLALKGGIAKFHLEKNELTWLLDIEKEQEQHRCNDGRCDPKGRLWVGTLHMQFEEGTGSLYCIDERLNMKKKLNGLTISNGMAWSPDHTRFYFIDSPAQTIQQFLFDEEKGDIVSEKIAVHIPKEMGSPDGMTIDEEGMLWVAHYGGFGVYRWNPLNGQLLATIRIPVPNVTSCAFVGENRDQLLITSALQELSEEDLAKYPQSGNVFIAHPGVKGLKPFPCVL